MAEFPALPLWTDAYLGDTRHLSTLEHGAYLLLLMTAWRSKETSLPDDDRLLAKYAGLGPRQWASVRPVLEAFYTIENGKWIQFRLVDEKHLLQSKREAAAANGRASALKRKGRHSTERVAGEDAGDQRGVNGCPTTTPTATPIPEDKSSGGGAATRGTRLPDDFVMPEDWKPYAAAKGHSRGVIEREAEKFTLHWQAETGRSATKRNWKAAWQKWVLGIPPERGSRVGANGQEYFGV